MLWLMLLCAIAGFCLFIYTNDWRYFVAMVFFCLGAGRSCQPQGIYASPDGNASYVDGELCTINAHHQDTELFTQGAAWCLQLQRDHGVEPVPQMEFKPGVGCFISTEQTQEAYTTAVRSCIKQHRQWVKNQ